MDNIIGRFLRCGRDFFQGVSAAWKSLSLTYTHLDYSALLVLTTVINFWYIFSLVSRALLQGNTLFYWGAVKLFTQHGFEITSHIKIMVRYTEWFCSALILVFMQAIIMCVSSAHTKERRQIVAWFIRVLLSFLLIMFLRLSLGYAYDLWFSNLTVVLLTTLHVFVGYTIGRSVWCVMRSCKILCVLSALYALGLYVFCDIFVGSSYFVFSLLWRITHFFQHPINPSLLPFLESIRTLFFCSEYDLFFGFFGHIIILLMIHHVIHVNKGIWAACVFSLKKFMQNSARLCGLMGLYVLITGVIYAIVFLGILCIIPSYIFGSMYVVKFSIVYSIIISLYVSFYYATVMIGSAAVISQWCASQYISCDSNLSKKTMYYSSMYVAFFLLSFWYISYHIL